MTFKNMSRATRREYEKITGRKLNNTAIFGQVNIERFYMETGYHLGGCSEIRQVWTPNQAKPRTYYSMGGDHFKESKPLQGAFTALVNSNESTHHVSRLLPARIRLKTGQHLLVYDLETFTSRMSEQISYMEKLAIFCLDTEILVMDSAYGLIRKNLGEMLGDYNEICNKHGDVSYERVTGTEEFMSHQSCAGMLGVYGNLMTCTHAHGLLMMQCVEDESQVNVAGDDGAIAEDDANKLSGCLYLCPGKVREGEDVQID